MLAVTPPDLRCTIRAKIDTKAVLVTSLDYLVRCYGKNKKTRIIVGTFLEVEIRPKSTTSGMCRAFDVAKFDLGGLYMKVATIKISSVKLHTPEPLHPATDNYVG